MRLSYYVPVIGAFLAAAVLSVTAAGIAVAVIERQSLAAVESRLLLEGHDWASIEVDGLQVRLSGQAPDEPTRFRAVSAAGAVIDPTRIIDQARVGPSSSIEPPRFSVEILRNEDDISLIGLAPQTMDREAVTRQLGQIAGDNSVSDLLEIADYPAPAGWDEALAFGLEALEQLQRAKISILEGSVSVRAITASAQERTNVVRRLTARAPAALELNLDIAAPRPVVTPFTLRFLIDDRGPRFDACTAHTTEGRDRILEAAQQAGMVREQRCRLGLGVPSPYWPDAAVAAIAAVGRLKGGSVTLSDADVTLVAAPGTDPALFDSAAGELETALPDVFSLNAVLPEPEDSADGAQDVPEFVATLSPEGLVQLRGRMPDQRLLTAVNGFALARFGGREVRPTLRVDEGLPAGWSTRVLAAVEALSFLDYGSVRVRPDEVNIRGATGNLDANDEVSRVLSDKLGAAARFVTDITYEEALDPIAALPTPQECVADVNAVLARRKITFAPGSTEIEGEARDTLDQIAEIMRDCEGVEMEIGGHTDSQGREGMNERLSQSRADAVLSGLLARRVLTSNLSAKGYGESRPIADNDTEAGREANRRIEFKLAGANADDPDQEGGVAEADADAEAEAEGSTEPEEGAQADSEEASPGETDAESPAETDDAQADDQSDAETAAEDDSPADTDPDAAEDADVDAGTTEAPDGDEQTEATVADEGAPDDDGVVGVIREAPPGAMRPVPAPRDDATGDAADAAQD